MRTRSDLARRISSAASPRRARYVDSSAAAASSKASLETTAASAVSKSDRYPCRLCPRSPARSDETSVGGPMAVAVGFEL